MNSAIEITEKTIEGAVEKGICELGIKRDNARIDVITEPGAGFFGILGARQAKVKVSVKREPAEYLRVFLKEIMDMIEIKGEIILNQEEDNINIDIKGNDMGILIGRRGQNLNALQYLLNTVLFRQFAGYPGRVLLDIENYRQEREVILKELALKMAGKAIKLNKEVVLEPMSSQERRIIHMTLREKRNIRTYSSGDDPYRRIVIGPARK